MKTIIVDDEYYGLERFEIECNGIRDVEIVGKFRKAADALEYACTSRVDLAFLDIEMPGMSGLQLAEELRKIYRDIIVIFVSAHDEYMSEAFKSRSADYYILKPYEKKDVQAAIYRAGLLSGRQTKRISIHTLGAFEIYNNGVLVRFSSYKAKEILAYIVAHNGNTVTNSEICSAIWGVTRLSNHSDMSVFYNALRKLRNTLQRNGISELLISFGGEHKINIKACDCDFSQYLEHENGSVKDFRGHFLCEYAWSEQLLVDMDQNKSGT